VTVPDFLAKTSIPVREIAKHCGVHKTQVYRWKRGDSLPAGDAAFRFVELMARPEKKRRRKAA
jgi:uncharacterized protein YjcR